MLNFSPITKRPFSPSAITAFLEIITRKGEKISGTTDYAWGDGSFAPDKYRATNQDLEQKFREAVTLPGCILANKPDKVEQAVNLLWNLEELESVRQLTQIFSET